MAKSKKNKDNGEAPAKKKKAAPPSPKKPDFGVEQLAEYMELTPFTVRGKLRSAGIAKDGRTYDFNSEAGVEKVSKELRANEKPKKEKKAKEDKPKKEKKAKKNKKSKSSED